MAQVPEIPGFYYDQDKNRYFKIEKDGNVHGAHQHSTSRVTKLKRSKAQQMMKIQKSALQKRTQLSNSPIKRCKMLKSTLSGTRILSEISQSGSIRHETLLQRYLDFLPSGDTNLQNPDIDKMPRCMLSLNESALVSGFSISSFAWDEESMALFYALNLVDGRTARSRTYIGGAYYPDFTTFLQPTKPQITHFGPDRKAGIQVEPAPFKTGHALGNYFLGDASVALNPGKCVSITGFREADQDLGKNSQTTIQTLGSLTPAFDHPYEQCGIAAWKTEHKFPCARGVMTYSPFETGDHRPFAFGAQFESMSGSDGAVFEFDASINGFPGRSRAQNFRLGITHSSVKAVEYLSRNVIVAGLQNGGIVLYDRRARDSEGVVKVHHQNLKQNISDPINHIAIPDSSGNSLVAVGLGRMSLYDIRMSSGAPNCSSKSFEGSHLTMKPTISLFDFDYNNQWGIHAGFSLSVKHKIVTAAQGDGTFRVYSIKDGTVLRSFKVPQHQLESNPNNLNDYVYQRYGGATSAVSQLQIIDDATGGFHILALQNGMVWNYDASKVRSI
jgi:hypothetical protein